MKRYSFGTFLVDESNRDAFEICRDVADLRPVSPLPLVLLADEGCGKTHLLYSIVNRVRASSARTGLAYVTARDFPDQVRALIDDPSPVKRAQSAVLLVDQLEQFDTLVEELEAVVRVFLDNKHYVVMASSVHPGRLHNLTPGLRTTIQAGQTVQVMPQSSDTRVELVQRAARKESPGVLDKQREEIDRLRTLLATAEKEGASRAGADFEALRNQLDVERAAKDELTKQLNTTKAYCDSLQNELETANEKAERAGAEVKGAFEKTIGDLRGELARTKARVLSASEEADRLRAEVAGLASGREEMLQLRGELEAARGANQTMSDRLAGLREVATEKASLESKVQELQNQLEAARTEGDLARGEAGQLVERAETLLALIESNRQRFAQAEQEHGRQVAELEALLKQRTEEVTAAEEVEAAKTEAQDALKQLDSLRAESERERRALERALAETREQLEAELSLAKADAAHAIKTRQETLAEYEKLNKTVAEAETEREEFRRAVAQGNKERDELHEVLALANAQCNELRKALASADQANAERDELRRNLTQARAEHDELRDTLAQIEKDRDSLQTILAQSRGERESLQTQLEQVRQELGAQIKEMEALRHDAAGQVAEANAHAGEVERSLAALQSALENARTTNHVVGAELQTLRDQFIGAADSLAQLADHLASAAEIPEELLDETSQPERSTQPAAPRAYEHESEDLARAADDRAGPRLDELPRARDEDTPRADDGDELAQLLSAEEKAPWATARGPLDSSAPATDEESSPVGEKPIQEAASDEEQTPSAGQDRPFDTLATAADEEAKPDESPTLGELEFPEGPLRPLRDLSPLEDEADPSI